MLRMMNTWDKEDSDSVYSLRTTVSVYNGGGGEPAVTPARDYDKRARQ